MSDKLFAKRRILAFFMVLVLFFSVLVFLLPNAKINAETNSEFNVSSSGEVSNEVAMASGLEKIPEGEYDAFTDTDTFVYNNEKKSIWQYSEIYDGLYNKEKKLYDRGFNGYYLVGNNLPDEKHKDPIDQIVPLNLMKSGKDYLYCGKEYGFFISSVKESDEIVFSTVFVFDIIYNMNRHIDTNHNGCVSVEVAPVFQYRYVWLKSTNNKVETFYMKNYDNNKGFPIEYHISSDILVPHPNIYWNIGKADYDFDYSYQDIYYLTDISIAMSLFNEQALNYGDDGYDPKKDRGAFFIMAESEYFGRKLQKGELTDDDKTNIALFAVDCAINLVAFGANIVAPGSGSLLKMITTATNVAGDVSWAVSSSLAWENTYNNLQDSFTIKKNIATFNSLYANRAEQLKTYKNLAKSILVANNPENADDNIWYGQGDHYKAYFGINAEIGSGEQFPNTRALVECALKIVEKNKKANVYCAQNAVSKTVDNETYQERIEFANEEDIYLLPNGYNCFLFVPYYSGKYIFNFDFNNSVKIEMDGKEINGNSVDIVKDNTPNAPPIKIKIKNNDGNAVKGKLLIDVSSISQSIELNNKQETIVKVNVDSGHYHLSTGNNNVVFVSKYSNKNGFGLEEKFYSTSEIYTDLDNNSYIIIQNIVDTKVNVLIHVDSSIQTIEQNTTISKQLTTMTTLYYRMVLEKNLSYVLYYTEANNKGVNADVVDKYGRSLITSTRVVDKQCERAFNVDDEEEVYIKFYKGDLSERSISFIINEADLIDWRINGESIKNRTIELPRMKKITVEAYIDGKQIGISLQGNNNYAKLINTSSFYIEGNSPIGGNTCYYIQADKYWNLLLNVYAVFEKNIDLSWIDDNGNLEYSGGDRIFGFTYRVEVSDGNTTRKSSVMNVESNYEKRLYGKIDLSNIIEGLILRGGWREPYVDVIIRIESITVLERNEAGFDKTDSPTTYTAKNNELDVYNSDCYYFFDSGSGTQSNPYLVSSKKEFNSLGLFHRDFGKNLYFKQTVDLNFANDEIPKTQSKTFYGYLDGNKRSISISYEIKSDSSLYDVGGLFTSNYGTICNYSNISYTVKSSLYYDLSGIVDYNGGTISDITANIDINNLGSSTKKETYYMGGITAYNDGTIKNVTVNANIKSCSYYVGGIAGQNHGVIEQCNVKGTIDLYSERDIFYAGSIAGESDNKVWNCSSAGSTISYKVGASDSRTLAPRIGSIIGVWSGGTMLATGSGSVSKGSLKTVTWWEGLKKQSHDQAGFVKVPYGQKTF